MLEGDNLLYLGECVKDFVIDLMYPIHSIYMTYDDTDPNVFFGGKWIRLNDCFIYAANGKELNGYDGSKKVNIEHLPPHTHTFTGNAITGQYSARPYSVDINGHYAANGCFTHTPGGGYSVNNRFNIGDYQGLKSNLMEFKATPSGTISNTGDGMDYTPYHLKVIMWKRIE